MGPPPEVTQEYQHALRIIPPSTEDILTEIELIKDKNNIRNTVQRLLDKNMPLQPEPSGLLYPLKKVKKSIHHMFELCLSVFRDERKVERRVSANELANKCDQSQFAA